MTADPAGLPVLHAVALGLLQGPVELLPVSSSGHLVLVPALAGSPYAELEPELRKAFEVALHLGTAAALLIALRGEVIEVVRSLDARRALGAVLAFAPPAAAGLLLERPIERRLGAARAVAGAQILAGLALGVADRRPARLPAERAGVRDHALIGLAQAAALAPGVSRNGATLTAARLRGFTRPAASRLSRHAALPIIVGAGTLKGARLARRRLPSGLAPAFAAGALAAFVSTLATSPLLAWTERANSYAPFAAYRAGLGMVALTALRRQRRRGPASRPPEAPAAALCA